MSLTLACAASASVLPAITKKYMSFVPYEILNDVIDVLQTDVPTFAALSDERRIKNVREYDDEFRDERVDWSYDFPIGFVRVVSGKPRIRYVDGTADVYDYDIVVFVAVKSEEGVNQHILELLTEVRNALEGAELTIGNEDYMLQTGQFDFIMKNNAVTVYTLDVGTVQAVERG